jgi:hypothetical protein
MPNSQDIHKLIELLRNLQPQMPEAELEKQARNLYDLAVFIVHQKINQYSKSSQPENPP